MKEFKQKEGLTIKAKVVLIDHAFLREGGGGINREGKIVDKNISQEVGL